GHAYAPALAPGAIDFELEVGLPHDVKDADVFHAPDPGIAVGIGFFQLALDLLGQLLEFEEIRPDDLDRVIALDARQRLGNVVANVLGKVPVDAGQLAAQQLVHGLDQLVLAAAAEPVPPARARLRGRPFLLSQER